MKNTTLGSNDTALGVYGFVNPTNGFNPILGVGE
jgi:hypothetical protein